jgi:hypothetical protein
MVKDSIGKYTIKQVPRGLGHNVFYAERIFHNGGFIMRANHPVIVSFIFLCFVIPATYISPIAGLNSSNVASIVDTKYGPELLPDPNLAESPSVSINGTSEEFSHVYHESTGGSDFNYVNLTWTHTAGTNLSYKSTAFSPYPRCNDFILLTQEFAWSWEEFPMKVITGLDYRITRTGDFETHERGTRMFHVTKWLIDSSGNWENCGGGEYYSQYPNDFIQVASAIQGTLSHEIFGGMIENSEGLQEDPEDSLTLAIGLIPSYNFFNDYFVDSAYLNWTGTVTVTIKGITSAAFGWPDPDSIPTPPLLGLWHSDVPSRGDAVTVASDDYVYTVGSEGDYSSGDLDLILQKWDMNANLLWTREISGESVTSGLDVLVSDNGYIYTLGRYSPVFGVGTNASMVVTQWDSDGNQIDSMILELDFKGPPRSFVMDSEGSFYIVGGFDIGFNGTYYPTVLKCDQGMDIMWNRTWGDYPSYDNPSIAIDSTDNIYVMDYLGQMAKLDTDGNVLWEKVEYGAFIAVDDEDYLYSLSAYQGHVFVAKYYGDTGTQIWNTTWGYNWYGYAIYDHRSIDIAVGGDGSVCTVSSINPGLGCDLPIVVSFNTTNGAHQWNRTWLPDLPNRAWKCLRHRTCILWSRILLYWWNCSRGRWSIGNSNNCNITNISD